MPQRNGKNPIKLERNFGQGGGQMNNAGAMHSKPKSAAGICPSCSAEVPPIPGFRFSSLKCPKCGASMGQKPYKPAVE